MPETPIQLTIFLEDSQLNDEQLQEATENLCDDIREVEGVDQADLVTKEQADLVTRKTASPNSQDIEKFIKKDIGGFLVGTLTAEVNFKNLKTLVRFLGDRLFGKTIKIQAEGNGKKLDLEIRRPEDLEVILPQIDDFING